MAFIVQLVNRASKVTSPATVNSVVLCPWGPRYFRVFHFNAIAVTFQNDVCLCWNDARPDKSICIHPKLCVVRCKLLSNKLRADELLGIRSHSWKRGGARKVMRDFHGKEELCVNLCLSNQL